MMLPLAKYEALSRSAYPKYCLKMATGTGKTWVLQALLYWQLLNAARAPEDRRFTRNFLLVAPGLIVYQRLLDAFLGRVRKGAPDWETSDLARNQGLFVPDSCREEVFRFVQGNVCTKEDLGTKVTAGCIPAPARSRPNPMNRRRRHCAARPRDHRAAKTRSSSPAALSRQAAWFP